MEENPARKKSQGKQRKTNDNSNKSTNRRNNATIDSGALHDGVLNRALRPVDDERYDLLLFFANVKPIVIQFLQSRIEQEQGIKWYISTQVKMYKENPDGTVETDKPHFRSINYRASSLYDLNQHEVNEDFKRYPLASRVT